jgi:hypothetical protein
LFLFPKYHAMNTYGVEVQLLVFLIWALDEGQGPVTLAPGKKSPVPTGWAPKPVLTR